MKVVVLIVLGMFACATYVGVGLWAFNAGVRTAAKDGLRRLGLTIEHARLYRRAVKLLNRLAQVTDLDGMYAGDSLSPTTKKLVTSWVADYKREIEKA